MPEHMRCSAPVLLSGIQIDRWQVTLTHAVQCSRGAAGFPPKVCGNDREAQFMIASSIETVYES